MTGSKLVVGPWAGELGWELMMWQGYVRYLTYNNNYNDVVILCRDGHQGIYLDMKCVNDSIVIPLPMKHGDTDCQRNSSYTENDLFEIARGFMNPGDTWLNPYTIRDKVVRGVPVIDDQIFVPLSDYDSVKGDGWIAIHPRWTSKGNTGYRNWSPENWDSLTEQLVSLGYRIVIVGHPGQTVPEIGSPYINARRVSTLMATAAYLLDCDLAIGPSSGPMHLASLCKVPHLVWSGEPKNVVRYTELWNPFNTVVTHMPTSLGWQPTVEAVLENTLSMLESREAST